MIKAVIFDMYETLITHYDCPLYFGSEMAADAGIKVQDFLAVWRPTEPERSTGKITFEEIIERILRMYDAYSDEKLDMIVRKRVETKREGFCHLHPEIIPMLTALHEKGVKIGLISNCFSEEAKVIRESVLFPYFDAVCMSFEEGVQKPDPEIFTRCLDRLSLTAEECLYVGDGGSHELEAASAAGMKAVQAVWYLREGTSQSSKPRTDFPQFQRPLEVVNAL